MRFAFHLEAEAELLESASFYESRSPGLGHEFVVEIFRYSIQKDQLRILAVMNLRRRPGYWSARR